MIFCDMQSMQEVILQIFFLSRVLSEVSSCWLEYWWLIITCRTLKYFTVSEVLEECGEYLIVEHLVDTSTLDEVLEILYGNGREFITHTHTHTHTQFTSAFTEHFRAYTDLGNQGATSAE